MPNVVYHADIAAMSGSQADMVYTRARSGPTRRSRVRGTNPRTPAQSAARTRLTLAVSAYSGLSPEQVAAWEVFSATQVSRNRLSGAQYVPSANSVFTGLTAKFLQITPGGTIPVMPPDGPFAGDLTAVTAAAASGGVAFTASRANGAGVETELLLQRLASPVRKPEARKYRSRGFVAFASGSLTHLVSMPAGVYAAAYRFVSPITGQDTVLTPVGVVTVA